MGPGLASGLMGDDPVRRLTDNMMLTIPESERSRDKWAKRAFPAGDSPISTLRLWLAVSVLAGLLFIVAFVGNVAAGSYWWAAVFAVSVVFFCLQIARLVLWIRARRRA